MVKKCISYAKENHSKLFVCYLDIQKAFDRMWHDGLFVKLYDLGIRSKLLGIIIDLHTKGGVVFCLRGINLLGSKFFKASVRVVLFPLLCFCVLTTTYSNNWSIVMSDSKC